MFFQVKGCFKVTLIERMFVRNWVKLVNTTNERTNPQTSASAANAVFWRGMYCTVPSGIQSAERSIGYEIGHNHYFSHFPSVSQCYLSTSLLRLNTNVIGVQHLKNSITLSRLSFSVRRLFYQSFSISLPISHSWEFMSIFG